MKILFLSWNFPPALGGIEYVAKHLYYGLKERGIGIKLIARYSGVSDGDPDIYRCKQKNVFGYNLFSLLKALSLNKKWKFDIIVCGSIASAPAARIISFICKTPYIVLMHGSDVLYGKKLYQLILKYLVQHADALCANSFYTKDLLMQIPCENHKVRVIYPGVCCEKFINHSSGEVFNNYKGRKTLLTVGRLVKRKGVLEFITCVMPILIKIIPDILYLVVGDDATQSLAHKDRMRKIIQDRIDALNLQDYVTLLGNLSEEELIQLYLRSDLFVLPCIELHGDAEGFGVVFLEAALSWTPSVATRTGGIPEAVIDGKTGLLVDPSDYEGIIEVISKMFTDNHLRESLAGEGKKRVHEKFCWNVILSQYLDLFTTIKKKKVKF
jgi:phosphatidyl-myo-inositol dimannoside synthase